MSLGGGGGVNVGVGGVGLVGVVGVEQTCSGNVFQTSPPTKNSTL